MAVECWAIIIVILLIAFTFLRSRKASYAMLVLPLLVVPFVHLLGSPLTGPVLGLSGGRLSAGYIRVAVDMVGLMVACFLFGGLSRKIPSKLARRVYIALCGGFTVILTLVLLHYLLESG